MHQLHLILQRLADAGLEFVVIGGYAGVIHGSALITNDVDICAVLSPENVEKIRAALGDLHPFHRATHRRLSLLDHPAPGETLHNLYLQTDQGIVDVLSSVLGLGDFARLKASAEDFEIAGRMYSIISLEDLIVAKQAVGREKDLLAVKELRAIAAKRERR
jgi:predicted nucleotidyltransferase